MPTSPIQPIAPLTPATTAATPAAPTTPPTTPPVAATTRASNVTTAQASSPLKQQERDPRGQPDYEPCNLIFLNGPYEGKTIDLGLAVNSVTGDQSADWSDQESKGIRPGVNFNRLSNREFRLELEYWALSEDVFHLVENLATAQEIGAGAKQPPFLLFQQGSATIAPVVCTSYSPALSEPHPGRKGFRHGKCSLSFKLAGGRDSEHALGKPLTATPLGDARATQTQLEQQQQAQQQITQLLLLPCIGQQGSAALTDMIEQNKLGDPAAIAALPPETIAQAAIAGILPVEALKNPSIAPLVRAAIASSMAAREPGIGNTTVARQVADGWLTGNFAGIRNATILNQAQVLQGEFEAIATAVINQKFDQVLESGNTAGERLRQFGACGLRLRSSGSVDIRSPKDEAGTLTRLNETISTQDDEALKQRFGITEEREIKALRNGAPYQSRQEFVQHLSQLEGASVGGLALWSRFESSAPDPGTPEGADSPTPTPS